MALAVLELGENRKPTGRCEVDSLGDIEPKVEALVIGRGEGYYKFSGALALSNEDTCESECWDCTA